MHTAPGTYDPEKSMKAVLDSTPQYSFRIKHKDPKPDNIPGEYSHFAKH